MNRKKMAVADLVAFWRYDQFPFVLGGHVTDMNKYGSVETKEYGPGFYFKPFKLLPKVAGEQVFAQLHVLREEHDAALRALRKEWRDKLLKELPWAKEVR